jgi:hypothetical protein
MKLIHVIILFLITVSAFSQSQQVTITASRDNTLYENVTGATSNGKGDYMFTGRTGEPTLRRALVRFTLAGNIPSIAYITSVSLKMYMSKTISGAVTVNLYKLNSDWGEGISNANGSEGTGAPSSTGDATWIHKFYNTSLWSAPGGDFSSISSGALSVASVGSYTWPSTPQLTADVQDWLLNPSTNFGWILIGNETVSSTAKRFNTRENPDTTKRPMLTVTYTVPSGIITEPGVPENYSLSQNFPNPFNPVTSIRYSLKSPGYVTLKVYNILGEEVSAPVNGFQNAGNYRIEFNGNDLAGGTYFYRLINGEFTDVKRMELVK